ncbi:ATP-binding protein [Haloferula sp. BvORR071]|uniref:ATP-binding protein n=1 Tax=Haloferula sp. BvORR071 TaxID=1396141 RepID=UPI00054DE4BF|nr:ATP-binding protein [Haloferula sp. BvORR071]
MKSLRAALTIRLLLGGVLLLGVAGASFQWRLKKALVAEFDTSLLVTAHSLEALVENENGKIRVESQAEEMPEFGHRGGASIFLLERADSIEIQRSSSLGDMHLDIPPSSSDIPTFSELTLPDGRSMRCVSLIVDIDSEEHGEKSDSASIIPVKLLVGRENRSLDHTLQEIGNASLIMGVITLGALAVLLLWGIRRGLSPLGKLVEQIEKIDGRSLSTRLNAGRTPSELLPVVDRLNELLARLERVFEREKRFTADVSHELRTPIAELRALAEVNLLTPPAGIHEATACWSEAQAIVLRMESLSIHLLELARAEQAGSAPGGESVDVNALLDRTLERHADAAVVRDVTFTIRACGAVTRESDPVIMELIFSNLIGNVTHHAVAGSTCLIELEQGLLKVSNAAAGLSAEDLPQLFDRYWKNDRSRSDSRRHGIGLTLAREAASLLGGSLEVEFNPLSSTITFIHYFDQKAADHIDGIKDTISCQSTVKS